MRTLFKHLAWALASAALIVATPLRAGAPLPASSTSTTSAHDSDSTRLSVSTFTVTATNDATRQNGGAAPRSAPAAATEVGGSDWDLFTCALCVGVGAYVIGAGGAVTLPFLLANTSTIGTLSGACLYACRSVIATMIE